MYKRIEIIKNLGSKGDAILQLNITISDAENIQEAWQAAHDELIEAGTFPDQEEGIESEQEETEISEDERTQPKALSEKKISDEIPEGFVDVNEVSEMTNLTAAYISLKMSEGRFPKPYGKHGRKNIWERSLIEAHIEGGGQTKADEPIMIDFERVKEMTGMDSDIIEMLIDNNKFPEAKNEDEDQWDEQEIKDYIVKRNAKK